MEHILRMGSYAEKKALSQKAVKLIVGAIVLNVGLNGLTLFLPQNGGTGALVMLSLGLLGAVASLVMWFSGLAAWAKSKALSPWLAATGILGLLGPIVIGLSKDKWVIGEGQAPPLADGHPSLAGSEPVVATVPSPVPAASPRRRYVW
ncbi:MAG: hypothetical protein KIT11_02655 [Fimbriimonadaceae bacterium]|nr:hypothetical protein [Fimbriimonadaceae bacterium]QYK54732.1 MAG: hypothetical protein KF733_06880 [Fimbriimonadaceae bacterium]